MAVQWLTQSAWEPLGQLVTHLDAPHRPIITFPIIAAQHPTRGTLSQKHGTQHISFTLYCLFLFILIVCLTLALLLKTNLGKHVFVLVTAGFVHRNVVRHQSRGQVGPVGVSIVILGPGSPTSLKFFTVCSAPGISYINTLLLAMLKNSFWAFGPKFSDSMPNTHTLLLYSIICKCDYSLCFQKYRLT